MKENQSFRIFSVFIGILLFGGMGLNAIPTNKVFYSVNDIYGISIRGANSVCEDDKGFIWVSSKAGVYRFTEEDKRQYLLPYVTPNVISVDLLYKNSSLFAYTNNGQFFKYDPLYDRFDLALDMRSLLNNNYLVVNNVIIGPGGTFFIATTFGLYRYSGEKGLELLSENDRVEHFVEWYDEEFFFLGREGSLQIVEAASGKIEHLHTFENRESLQMSMLYFDKESGQLWIGTNSGDTFLYDIRFDRLLSVQVDNFPKQPVLAIEANTDSTMLVGFDGQGVWELNKKGTEVLNIYTEDVDDPNSLAGNGVYDIFLDRKNRVWICTYSGGVSFYEQTSKAVKEIKHQINNPNSLVNNVVNDVYEDSKRNLWFATNNGISKWDVSKDLWSSFYENKSGEARVFLSIFEDNQGRMWAGTWGSGIFVFDRESGKEIMRFGGKSSEEAGFGEFIFDITDDDKGNLWIGGVVEEVVRYDIETFEFKKYGFHPVYMLEEISGDKMLLGCSYGLVLLDISGGGIEVLLEGFIIHDFLIDSDVVWCATSGGGLVSYNLNNDEVNEFTVKEGLPSNFVNSISSVDGFFWLGTESGLCRFSPETKAAVTYSSVLSLSNASFNQDAGIVLSTGELLLGTNQGGLLFDPEDLEAQDADGDIFIQDIIISGRTIRDSAVFDLQVPVDSLSKIILAHNRNTLTFELLPVGVSEPQSKVSWKLAGMDEDWSIPASNRMLTFANLPGGEYELKIRMLDSSLSQVIDERSLAIVIKPPFWRAWWFYILLIFMIVGVFYFFFRYHINLIQQIHSEEKIRFFSNTAHELRTSLTLISGPIEEIGREPDLSKKGRYYLDLANGQIKGLLNVATQLLDFQKVDKGKAQLRLQMVDLAAFVEQRMMMFESYAQRKNITLSLNVNEKGFLSGIDVSKMEKVIDNLLSNAIKYSHEGGNVKIHLFRNKKRWVLNVSDEGIGISAKGQRQLFKEFYRSDNAVNSEVVGSGIGLLMVKNYVKMHGGRVVLDSKENVGSTFTVEIPLRNVANSSENAYTELGSSADIEIPIHETSIPEVDESEELVGKLNILVVEDNDKLREFLQVSLRDEFNVLLAANGNEAFETARENIPDMVVSDIMMPEMDGFELCKLLKSTYETSHIPVILLTALTDKALQLQGLGLGADAYLTKPFDVSLLLGRIKSILTNRRIVREKAMKLMDNDRTAPLTENELNDLFVKKAYEVVKNNISNSAFGKSEFAAELNVSSSLLYKKMKALTDQSPSDFIRTVRLHYSRELLKTGDYSVTEVSEKCGFASVSYFSTVFKSFYRKSPTEFLGTE
ncbi:response regulator [Marinilabilia sp.]|uniref:hybrid sensor histidine kinase/response regulator transcription factor n=1 Tax=Marinilabilia sp. TaxID=2021252 RepID=UPI0025BFD445|nr:response regulator [Marinilabilia sp.]